MTYSFMQRRTVEQIQTVASMWWPADIKERASEAINLPYLLDTQTEFLSLLILAKRSPLKIFDLIETADFPANLFLKHLVILTDFGGEPIKRLGKSFVSIFPKDEIGYYFDFSWGDESYQYRFEYLPALLFRPEFINLREEPRFKRLVKNTGIEMNTGFLTNQIDNNFKD